MRPYGLAMAMAVIGSQDPEPPKLDQKLIDQAIDKGVQALRQKVMEAAFGKTPPPPKDLPAGTHVAPPQERQSCELVLWTFVHAGVPEEDPAFQKVFRICLEDPVWRTYNTALLAMVLQKMDPARYQPLIAQCGHFFADTQCESGQWDYGEGYRAARATPAKPKPGEAPPAVKIKRGAPPAGMKISKGGDNSNSQYAALGIRACREAGVELPEETLKRALEWWRSSQQKDGSWNYNNPPPAGTGKDAPVLQGCGSMTCGGIGSAAILNALLGRDPKQEESLKKGLEWLAENFSVSEHPRYVNPGLGGGGPAWWYYYYLYSLERVGDLLAAERIGEHAWYPEGARELLKSQKPNGAWKEPSQEWEVHATCFAILFLKRATAPVIKTEDARPKDPGK